MNRPSLYMFCRLVLLAMAVSLVSPYAVAECELPYPDKLSRVDGETASHEEISYAQESVKNYVSEGERYLACIQQAKEDLLISDRKYKKFNNEMVDEIERVVALFNRELRKYKRRVNR